MFSSTKNDFTFVNLCLILHLLWGCLHCNHKVYCTQLQFELFESTNGKLHSVYTKPQVKSTKWLYTEYNLVEDICSEPGFVQHLDLTSLVKNITSGPISAIFRPPPVLVNYLLNEFLRFVVAGKELYLFDSNSSSYQKIGDFEQIKNQTIMVLNYADQNDSRHIVWTSKSQVYQLQFSPQNLMPELILLDDLAFEHDILASFITKENTTEILYLVKPDDSFLSDKNTLYCKIILEQLDLISYLKQYKEQCNNGWISYQNLCSKTIDSKEQVTAEDDLSISDLIIKEVVLCPNCYKIIIGAFIFSFVLLILLFILLNYLQHRAEMAQDLAPEANNW